MEKFNSGDHVFYVYDIDPKQSTKGTSLTITLDVPFTEELFQELGHFIWKDVKANISESGKGQIETEFYVVDVKPKDYKEGPRLRVLLRQPFESKVFEKMGKMLWQDVNIEMVIIQRDLDFEPPDVEGEEGE